jgi:hypothetical protein
MDDCHGEDGGCGSHLLQHVMFLVMCVASAETPAARLLLMATSNGAASATIDKKHILAAG